jgi:very-short-patch-repair endonuclease
MQEPVLRHPFVRMRPMNADDELYDLAEQQHGFVTRLQAGTAGLSRNAVLHRIRRGEWVPHGQRVLHRSGTPWTRASPLVLAVFDAGPGAVVSHTTAATWWGLPGFDLLTIHITRPRGTTCAPAAFAGQVHEVLDLSTEQITVLDGVPIVRPERMIFELCATAHPLRAARALDTGWAKALYSGDSLRRIHQELACRGRAGTVVLRELLEARPPGWIPPASNLEARFGTIMREASLGEWRRQVDVGDDAQWCGRVDFRSTKWSLVVEVQSERYHTALSDQLYDAARRERLEGAGLVVVEVWDAQVWHARHDVVATVRDGIARARARNPDASPPFLHLSSAS